MNSKHKKYHTAGSSLWIALLVLASCTPAPVPHVTRHAKAPHPKMETKAIAADAFIENLSFSRLSLASNPNDVDAIGSNLAALKSYDAQKTKHTKHISVTLVVLDYKTKQGQQQLIAPVSTQQQDFGLLQIVMDKLGTVPGTLQDIHLATVQVAPDATFVLPDDTAGLVRALEERQSGIMGQAAALPPRDDINDHLALLAFFTQHRYQDAAYLTLDNVRRMLAAATQDKTVDEETLQHQSIRLQSLEGTLKVELPYKF